MSKYMKKSKYYRAPVETRLSDGEKNLFIHLLRTKAPHRYISEQLDISAYEIIRLRADLRLKGFHP